MGFFCHFIPTGSPLVLTSFLFWVELFSRVVRPVTLTLRLCANITAGHVLFSVISRSLASSLFISCGLGVVLLVVGVSFWLFEAVICFIQAVVFFLLLFSYFSERKY